VESIDTRERAKRRHRQRLVLLRQRAAIVSALGFAAFLGLAAQHAVGSSKRHAAVAVPPPTAPVTATYFDQRADGFAFDDASPAPLPPPVAQTNVS
jgi:hypothetical protein